jgi:hypothetical protein
MLNRPTWWGGGEKSKKMTQRIRNVRFLSFRMVYVCPVVSCLECHVLGVIHIGPMVCRLYIGDFWRVFGVVGAAP